MIDFPNSPSVGQSYTSGGQTWIYDGTKWVVAGATGGSTIYLPITGGTLTGPLSNSPITGGSRVGGTIDAAPIGQTTPAAGSFTNVQAASLNGGPLSGMRNRLLNGFMWVDQRYGGAGVTPAVSGIYVLDRWTQATTQPGKWNFSLGSSFTSAAIPGDFGTWLSGISNASSTLAAADFFTIQQLIEGTNIADFLWGNATLAKPAMLSFWAFSSVGGLHSGSLVNAAGTRSLVFSFTLAASTWTYVTIPIPADTAGTWTYSTNASLIVRFNLGCGATYLGPVTGAWSGSNFIGATGSVQLASLASGSSLSITGVQLERGTVATPYERRSYAQELSLCQRYYQQFAGANQLVCSGYNTAGSPVWTPMLLPVTMRATPAIAYANITYGNASGLGLNSSTPNSIVNVATATATGAAFAMALITASAEL